MMVGLTVGFIPILRLANMEWYANLVSTFLGQLALRYTEVRGQVDDAV